MTYRLASIFAESSTRTYYELARLNLLNQWWHWIVLTGLLVALIAFVLWTYRRDTSELSRPLRWVLSGLRLAALVGMFVFFLQLEKRIEHKVVKHSRTIVLVDTSQSMGLEDEPPVAGDGQVKRIQKVIDTLDQGPLLADLREKHDVVVFRFDQGDAPAKIATLARTTSSESSADETSTAATSDGGIVARRLARVGLACLGLACLAFLTQLVFRNWFQTAEGDSWALLVAVFALIVGIVTLAVGNLRYPDYGILPVFGPLQAAAATSNDESPPASVAAAPESEQIDWQEKLQPSGVETRLGDALNYVIEHERGGPLAGVVVISDGNQNSGADVSQSVALAQAAGIQLFSVGVGSPDPPASLRVVDVEAPPRVYPADNFTLKAFLQSFGWQGRDVRVQLLARAAAGGQAGPETLIDEEFVRLTADGEATVVTFEVVPDELGKFEYVVRATPPPGVPAKERDLEKTARIQVVDRKNRVLLFAGGPTREYRFVRVLCFRDKETTVDVFLQGAPPGAAQEADAVLEEFPSTAEELFEYDCLVAFDPDWQQLSDEQIELVDRWLSSKAGGLITIAGPVYTPEWTTLARDRRGISLVKGFYPVSFYRRSSMRLARGRDSASQPWPIELTDAGRQARHLWLDDNANRSAAVWDSFAGVYSYFPVRAAKPGAVVFGMFSNPQTAIDNQLPTYLAGQFYGAGRVFYIGSGEFWRLRAVDPDLFDTFYMKLIRYVSEGRLLRDSSRGVLIVSKDRSILGETIVVRASLTDAQFQPLVQEQVEAALITPDGMRQPFPLRQVTNTSNADSPAGEGSYAGQFTAVQEGDYRIELPIPDSETLEMLTRNVRVRVPDREIESPQRNDAQLAEMATATGGRYFPSLSEATSKTSAGLVAAMVPQDQETYIPGTPDKAFQQRLMSWLMGFICGALCIEWTVRRLNKLA